MTGDTQPVPLTARRLNRATLARQMLLGRERTDPVTAVQRLCAVQAQEAASPYIALWSRLADFDPATLDTAFAEQAIVKATLMRTTLHAVAMADYPPFQHAMSGYARRARTRSPRFESTGLSDAEVGALARPVTEFAREPRTNVEINAFLHELLGPVPEPGPWWALRPFAPIVHAPTGGPWSFGWRPAYVAARAEPVESHVDACLEAVALSFLAAFGPASVLDSPSSARWHAPTPETRSIACNRNWKRSTVVCTTSRVGCVRTPTRLPRRDCCRCGTASCSPTPTAPGSSRRRTGVW